MPAGNRLTKWILIALLLGLGAGFALNRLGGDVSAWTGPLGLLTTVFLRLIKMVIAPLVFATLAVGIAKVGDVATVGRIGLKAFGWFVAASLASLTLGLVLVNLLQPGVGISIALPDAAAASGVAPTGLTLQEFVTHLVPTSIVDGMARNEILQIVVFSVFFGVACAGVGEKATALVDALEGLSYVMLKLTMLVMWFAPVAVFAAVTSAVAQSGFEVIAVYGRFMGEFYLGIALLWLLLFLAATAVIGLRAVALFRAVREPALLAFATASSEAAYPKTLAQLEQFGCSNRVASFVLPLGYSFNLDGSMMYQAFAALFIAQAFGIHMGFAEQVSMLLVMMIASKGIAGVPRASLVVVAAVAPMFNLPAAGILLIMGIDQILDMGRTLTNVLGNGLATAAVTKWQGEVDAEPETDAALVAA